MRPWYLVSRRGAEGPLHPPFSGKYVHPLANGTGDGSYANPWSYAQALTLADDQRVWMRDGTYDSAAIAGWQHTARGHSGTPTEIRSFPYETASIRSTDTDYQSNSVLRLLGDYTTYRNVAISYAQSAWAAAGRVQSGDVPSHGKSGCEVDGNGSKILNAFFRDCPVGILAGDAAHGTEMSGLLVLNNGYSAADRHHGPCLYTAHAQGTGLRKSAKDCIFAYGFEVGIKSAGDGAAVCDYDIADCIIWRPGSHCELDPVFVSGGSPWELYSGIMVDSVTWARMMVWSPYIPGSVIESGFNQTQNSLSPHGSLSMTDMWAMVGQTGFNELYGWPGGFTYQNNKVWLRDQGGAAWLIDINPYAWATGTTYVAGTVRMDGGVVYNCILGHTSSSGNRPPNATYWQVLTYSSVYNFSGNQWFGTNPIGGSFVTPGAVRTTYAAYAALVGETGGSYSATGKLPDLTKVTSNAHEAGRATVGIGQPNAMASTVTVDLSGVTGLSDGDKVTVFYAGNNQPVPGLTMVTWNASTGLAFPMTEAALGTVPAPYGPSAQIGSYVPPSTLPEFGAFIVRKSHDGVTSPVAPGGGCHPALDL